jgi:hypothetical protein
MMMMMMMISVAFPCPTWSNDRREVKIDAPMTMDMPVSMRSTMAVEEVKPSVVSSASGMRA